MFIRKMPAPRSSFAIGIGLVCAGLVAAGSATSEATLPQNLSAAPVSTSVPAKTDSSSDRADGLATELLLEVPPPLDLPSRSHSSAVVTDGSIASASASKAEHAKPSTSNEDRTAASSTKAIAKFEGTAAPGLRIWLSAAGSRGQDLRFLWLQTKGPTVEWGENSSERVSVLVPGDATELAFRLIVSGRDGMDHTSLDIPLDLHARPMLPSRVVADAGDDQTGMVGHRITLNGIRSRPREHAVYRWIQTHGPEAVSPLEEAWVYSFVPTAPGLYRFALVVAADGVISKPSVVRVSVADKPPADLSSSEDRAKADPIEGQARTQLRRMEDGRRYAMALAEAFADVSEKASLYDEYEQLFSEIARRIDTAIPPDEVDRAAWDEIVFGPLTARIVQSVRPLGLDLNRRQARGKVMSAEQKEKLGTLFAGIARGFRSVGDGAEAAPISGGGGESP